MLSRPRGQIGWCIKKFPLASREEIEEIRNALRLHLVQACWRRDEQAPIILEPKTQSININTAVHRGMVSQQSKRIIQ
jgi:hypothetical protein